MRTFAQKQNQPLQKSSAHTEVRPTVERRSETPTTNSFSHDFSRTPVHAPAPITIQSKLAVGTPGDKYEQEADQVAEQVMRPHLQGAGTYGSGSPGCQREQSSPEHARVQTKHVGASDSGQIPASPIVHEALASPGQPLDASTRAFFEPRFGHDFSRVHVHTDAKADESASAAKALAYTVGRDVVFGAGRYAPGTTEGDRLLAHELTHVVQQTGGHEIQGSNGPLSVSASGTRIQRDTAEKTDLRSRLKHVGAATKALSNGVIVWGMWVIKDGNQVIMTMSFSPFPKYRGKTITFLQTMEETGGSSNADLDVLTYGKRDTATDDFEPFYGANWNNKVKNWEAEGAPGGFKNQPGGVSDPNAYFFDVPMVYPGQTKMFETAVVVPETTEVLASIKWGAEGDDDEAKPILPPASEPSDQATAGFLVAVDRFYEQPSTVGPDILSPQRYDAILDRFPPNGATLTADQNKSLDPIATKVKERKDRTIYVSLGGFADATEKDPSAISEARAKAVESYLVAQGVPPASILMAGFFGAAWARFPPGPKEDRNRRVQVRVHWGPPRK
jgi:outer membrane protein OmpA-like peptidoglycan-associated protein